ncbi:hypothetical protein ACIPXU_15230, partial [Streptomyces sp. NPDC090029]
SWCKTSTEFSGQAVGDEAENPTARAVGIPLLHEGEEVKLFLADAAGAVLACTGVRQAGR